MLNVILTSVIAVACLIGLASSSEASYRRPVRYRQQCDGESCRMVPVPDPIPNAVPVAPPAKPTCSNGSCSPRRGFFRRLRRR